MVSRLDIIYFKYYLFVVICKKNLKLFSINRHDVEKRYTLISFDLNEIIFIQNVICIITNLIFSE